MLASLISSSDDESRSVQLQINPTRWRSAILLVGCLAAPVPVRASSVQVFSSCSAPTSGRAQNTPCLSFSESFFFGFQGGPSPVGRRRAHPRRFTRKFPRRSPILPTDSAIEPNFHST